MLSKIKELDIEQVVEDSSGNAGASVAAYAARAHIRCSIYVPAATSPGKILQAEMYGAEVIRVPGSREATAAAVQEAAKTTYYASHNWSPYFLEGTKTFAFELWEQLGWQAPELVITPVGNGSLLLGAYHGFSELLTAGLIPKLPCLIGVQAAGCAPLYQAYQQGLIITPPITKSETIAEGISIAEPVHGREILQAVRETGGSIEVVSDQEIWETLQKLAQQGIYVEPTAAVAPAALTALLQRRTFPEDSTAVVALTGIGLKATEKLIALRE
jgi:threonine synthase